MPEELNKDQPVNDENETTESIAIEPVIPKVRSQFLAVLKIRNFMIFSLSQSVSLFGDKLDYMALLAMIAFFANKLGWQSARAISYLSLIITLPTILFGPLAGVLVDRWNRLKVLIFCDSCRTILVAFIPFIIIKTANLYLVYLISFTVFLFGLFFNTARLSIIPNLVAKRRLLAANSFMNFVGRISTFLGMFFGGLIVDWQIWHRIGIRYSWSAGFYIDSLSYCVSVVGLVIIAAKTKVFRVNLEQMPEQSQPLSRSPVFSAAQAQEKKMIDELRLAYQYIRKTPQVLFVFASIILMVIIGASAFVLLVPIIQSPTSKMGFGVGTKGVGFVAAVGSIGLVLSSMSYGIIGHRISKRMTILISFIVLGVIAALIPLFNSFYALLPLAFIAGLFLSPVFIAQDTILHEIVPEAIRGRIFSTREWLLNLSFGVSCLLVGELTNFFSKQHLLYVAGSLIVIISTTYIILLRKHSNWIPNKK
jgi:MFS family permease